MRLNMFLLFNFLSIGAITILIFFYYYIVLWEWMKGIFLLFYYKNIKIYSFMQMISCHDGGYYLSIVFSATYEVVNFSKSQVQIFFNYLGIYWNIPNTLKWKNISFNVQYAKHLCNCSMTLIHKTLPNNRI